MRTHARLNRHAILSAAVLIGTAAPFAGAVVWNPPVAGSGGSTSWTDPDNWVGASPPANDTTSDLATIGQSAYNFQPQLDANVVQSVKGLEFGGASTIAVTLSSITNTGAITTSTTSTSANSTTMLVTTASNVSVGQVLSGTGFQTGTFVTAITPIDGTKKQLTLSRATNASIAANTARDTISAINLGAGGITVLSGTNTVQTISAPVNVAANQDWTSNSTTNNALTVGAPIYLGSSTVTLKGVASSNTLVNGIINGTGGLVIDTSGSVTLGTNSGNALNHPFTGGVALKSGTLILGGGSTGGGTQGMLGTGLLTITGGTINSIGNSGNTALSISGMVWNGDFANTGVGKNLQMGIGAVSLGTSPDATRTVNVSTSTTFNVGGVISDGTNGTTPTKNLTKAGIGTMVLGGANTFTGDTNVTGGSLVLANSLALQNSTLATGGIAFSSTVASHAFTLGGLKGSGNLSLQDNAGTPNAVALTVGGNGQSTSYTGVLSGTGSLTKTGASTLELTNTNVFAGTTTVSGGTLRVTGALNGGAVTVKNTGTLGGTGTVTGVTVEAGGTLAPGASPGILNTGSVTLADDAVFAVELNGTSTTPTATYDQLNVTGTVDLGGADLSAVLGYAPVAGDKLFIVSNDDSDPITGRFAGLPNTGDLLTLSFNSTSYQFAISYVGNFGSLSNVGGNDVVLTAVPEPASLGVLTALGAMLLRRRRP